MKNYQFEEITMALSFIVAMTAHSNGFTVLYWMFLIKGCFDAFCAIRISYKSAMKDLKKKEDSDNPDAPWNWRK